ncbi:hypothetical protein POP15_071 [Pectobacterium phage POP15]|nr:hypothetical protein POP15_071 [Pectobacterium phage POP15]
MNEFIGRKVRVVKDTSEESPLSDNGWKIGDVGIIQMVLTDHPEYNIIVQRENDTYDTLGFSIEELELIDA